MSDDKDPSPRFKAQQTRFILLVIALGVALVALMLSGRTPSLGDTARLNTGHMAAFVYKPQPTELPTISFTDGDGKPMTLADFKGRVVLLNLWATWCLPCRKEMPDLDKLQAELGSDKFEVVALSIDRSGIAGSKRFLDQIATKNLKLYVDATAKMANELRVVGLPATLLIDAEGREIGRLLGPADWASEDAKALVRSVLKTGS
jgi:thiol-disulfide isomerase/thioredoxin